MSHDAAPPLAPSVEVRQRLAAVTLLVDYALIGDIDPLDALAGIRTLVGWASYWLEQAA